MFSAAGDEPSVIIENLSNSGVCGVIDIFLSVTDSFAALSVRQARSMCIRFTFWG